LREKEVPAELSRLAFEPRVLSHLKKNGERKIARKSRHVPRRPHEATRQRNCPRLSSSGHRAFQSPPSPGYVMHAHAWRPGANQVHDHLVALLVRDALRPAVAAATHRIIKGLLRDGLSVGQLYPSGNHALTQASPTETPSRCLPE